MDFLDCNLKHLHFQALNMWANWIETGDPCISADTAIKCGQKEGERVLNDDQKRLVVRLRDEAAPDTRKWFVCGIERINCN